jgi:CheY-like chemotaxis protein
MPAGGKLGISTETVELHADEASSRGVEASGRYVRLTVTDTGEGMDATTLSHLFEPFFTTRVEGSGLGLATVYGIVKQSGGYIWVYSEPAHGSVFKVYLPMAALGAVAADAIDPMARASETILLVEDEEAVRALTGEVLRRHGYEVIEAAHGRQALELALRFVAPIHLLLTDIVMPYMNGPDLAGRLVSSRPGTKVLFMSGYTAHAAVRRELSAGAACLQKPFTPDALARTVRGLLDG